VLALRYVLPALFASVVAAAVSWVALPDAPTTHPGVSQFKFGCCMGAHGWADCGGGFRRLCSSCHLGDRNKPQGWRRLTAPLLGLGCLARSSIKLPAVAWQRQGHFATCVHEPGRAAHCFWHCSC